MEETQSKLPTKYGLFDLYAFRTGEGEHLCLVKAPLPKNPLLRIHSECLTGDVFASQRCDCQSQLHASLKKIKKEGAGILIYLRQEGRGIGLFNKIRAYALQDKGFDTVEANEQLGFKADARKYSIAIEIVKRFGITKVRLLTNNPDKVKSLAKEGIKVEQIPLIILSPTTKKYLHTKKEKLGHLL